MMATMRKNIFNVNLIVIIFLVFTQVNCKKEKQDSLSKMVNTNIEETNIGFTDFLSKNNDSDFKLNFIDKNLNKNDKKKYYLYLMEKAKILYNKDKLKESKEVLDEIKNELDKFEKFPENLLKISPVCIPNEIEYESLLNIKDINEKESYDNNLFSDEFNNCDENNLSGDFRLFLWKLYGNISIKENNSEGAEKALDEIYKLINTNENAGLWFMVEDFLYYFSKKLEKEKFINFVKKFPLLEEHYYYNYLMFRKLKDENKENDAKEYLSKCLTYKYAFADYNIGHFVEVIDFLETMKK